MTTIAYDGRILATDSLMISGDTAFGSVTKIFKLKKGGYVALAGRVDVLPALVDWLNGDVEEADISPEDVFTALVVDKKGQAYEVNSSLRLLKTCVPWAGGTGESFALAAMTLGYDAVEAVELACRLDTCSRGPVQSAEIVRAKRCR